MPPFLRIVGWNDRCENARSRQLSVIEWVPLKVSNSNPTFLHLMFNDDGTPNPNGLAAWGIYCLLLMLAAQTDQTKHGLGRGRGSLIQENGAPHTALTIALRAAGGPSTVQLVKDVIEKLISLHEVEWVDDSRSAKEAAVHARNLANLGQNPQGAAAAPASETVVKDSVQNLSPNQPEIAKPGNGETFRPEPGGNSTPPAPAAPITRARGIGNKELGKEGKKKEKRNSGKQEREKKQTRARMRTEAGREPESHAVLTRSAAPPSETEWKEAGRTPAPAAEEPGTAAHAPKNNQNALGVWEGNSTGTGLSLRDLRLNQLRRAFSCGDDEPLKAVLEEIALAASSMDCEDRVIAALCPESRAVVWEDLLAAWELMSAEARSPSKSLAFIPNWFVTPPSLLASDSLIIKRGRLETTHVKCALYLAAMVSAWTGLPSLSRPQTVEDAEEAYAMFNEAEMRPEVFLELVSWIDRQNVGPDGRVPANKFSWRLRIKRMADIRRYWSDRKFHGFQGAPSAATKPEVQVANGVIHADAV